MDNAYTKSQMSELNELAKILGLEVIPEVDMPAHASKLVTVIPEFFCDVPDKEKSELSRWTVCAGTETVYGFYEKIITEVIKIFDGNYFHIGGCRVISLIAADRQVYQRILLCSFGVLQKKVEAQLMVVR